MSLLNLYYKAFREYREFTRNDKGCVKQRDAIKRANTDEDRLESIRHICHIDEEWIKQIEEGLPFIEKAIAEERQFIKNEGEVVIIEKAKHVSRESLEHLSRHSEMITRLPEDKDATLTPDKIYMVERLSDYAVYENRFLYMLLCYLRDFVDLRLKKLLEFGNTYKSTLKIRKKVLTRHGSININTDFEEENKRDPFSVFDKENLSFIERIESCQHIIVSLLQKPLMQLVSKASMLKPPITKTNVLKMNVKFRRATELYEYISQYQGDGFTIEEVKKTEAPFSDQLFDEVAEIINLISFVSYMHGNDLMEKLEREYEDEKRKIEEKKKADILAKIQSIRDSADKRNIPIEEYALLLEQGLDAVKEEIAQMDEFKKKVDSYSTQNIALKEEKAELKRRLSALDSDLCAKQYELEQAERKFASDVERVENECKQKIEENERLTSEKIEQVTSECDQKWRELNQKYEENDKERAFIAGQLRGLRLEHGLDVGEDYTTKEKFNELEKEYEAFLKYFKNQWKLTKKQIRMSLLWPKWGDKDEK